jgi:hypothetical protein
VGYSEEAKAAGRAAYAECRAAGGTLREMKCAYTKAAAKADPKTVREQHQRWRDTNREKCRRQGQRRNAKFRGHLPPDPTGPALPELIEKQAGICAACYEPLVNPVLDHDHKTGKVRGALCSRCNVGIGMLKDSPGVLRRAAQYLEAS